MRIHVSDHSFFALFPPYREIEAIAHPAALPSAPFPPRGAAVIWNLGRGNWGQGFKAVRDRPAGVALFILLPPASELEGLDRLLDLMEHCRPHSLLPHMEELDPEELVSFLKRFPSDLALELTDYLHWRGIQVDSDTRQLIRKTIQLSEELRTVSGLARSLYMSRRALGRRFATRGLPSPSHWLHFGRLLRASILLQNSDRTLYAVAGELGYPDGFSLSNQMHRLMNLRPSIMRECFGWEWIVEAWLHQEAFGGNLSPEMHRHLFPHGTGGGVAQDHRLPRGEIRQGKRLRVAEGGWPGLGIRPERKTS